MTTAIGMQLNGLRENELLEDKLAIEAAGFDAIFYGIIPFTTELTGIDSFPEHESVIMFGSTKLVKLWLDGHLPSNARVFYDPIKFDQAHYGKLLRQWMLNADAKFTTLGRVKDIPVHVPTFYKPTRDLKAFAGVVVEPEQTLAYHIAKSPQDSSLTDDEPVLLAPWQAIVREYRNIIIGGELVTASTYKINERVTYEPVTLKERHALTSFIELISKHYQPHINYVIDVAVLANGTFKIIEYNCINCAGMYACDRTVLFQRIAKQGRYHVMLEKATVGKQLVKSLPEGLHTKAEAIAYVDKLHDAWREFYIGDYAKSAVQISAIEDGKVIYRAGAV